MLMQNFKLVQPMVGVRPHDFTLMVTRDGGTDWFITATGNDASAMMKTAEQLISERKITHYVIARGEYVVS